MKKKWKKILAAVAAAVLLVSQYGTTSVIAQESSKEKIVNGTSEIQPVTNLRWSDETPGEAVFDNVNDTDVSFEVYWFKDGEFIGSYAVENQIKGEVYIPFYVDIFDSGKYTFIVETFAYGEQHDGDWESGCVSEVSSEFVYTKPSKQCAVPANITWDNTGVVSWDGVEHVRTYYSYLYDDNNGKDPESWKEIQNTCDDWSSYLASGKDYYVRIRAVSENINEYANGEYSDYIAFNATDVRDSVNEKLDDIMGENISNENVNSVVSEVKSAFSDESAKSELQIAMQTDSEVQEKIQQLEEQYKETKGVTIQVDSDEDAEIDTSSVKLLGAALNATSGGTVTFKMSKADEETQKELTSSSGFKKAFVLDLGLEGAGIDRGEALDIPVTVTMNAPDGLNVNALTILHYADNGSYEILPVRKNADGTISFTVKHFSNFVFGEREEASASDAGNDSVGVISSNSNGSSVIRVIIPQWKPTTPDEIKRYAVFGREKITYVADETNAYPVTVFNAMQGTRCFDSFEAVLGEYTIGRTYNIFPSGKIKYKMDSAARITLSIPSALQSPDREYKMICVTENGLPVILEDMDENPNTITFETDVYYAFALIYKDMEISE